MSVWVDQISQGERKQVSYVVHTHLHRHQLKLHHICYHHLRKLIADKLQISCCFGIVFGPWPVHLWETSHAETFQMSESGLTNADTSSVPPVGCELCVCVLRGS